MDALDGTGKEFQELDLHVEASLFHVVADDWGLAANAVESLSFVG